MSTNIAVYYNLHYSKNFIMEYIDISFRESKVLRLLQMYSTCESCTLDRYLKCIEISISCQSFTVSLKMILNAITKIIRSYYKEQ